MGKKVCGEFMTNICDFPIFSIAYDDLFSNFALLKLSI